jgi:hypothetical protein
MRHFAITAPLAAVLLAGCGLVAPQAPTSAGSVPVQNPGQPATAPATTAPTELPVLGTRTTGSHNAALEVSLREIRSGAGAMTVTFSLTNRASTGETVWVNSFFDDGVIQSATEGTYTVDGVSIIDTQNAKRYLPARSADHRCMCSTGLGTTTIGRDQTVFLSAVFQAVPADVTKVSVDIPHAGTFADIPVTR